MPRYIDADNIQYRWLPLSAMPDKFVTAEDIEQMPTADVVEVVRCNDCKWWTKQPDSLQGRCAWFGTYPTEAWYCGNAWKREENENA